MLSNLVNLITKSLASNYVSSVQKAAPRSYNPFEAKDDSNPFMATSFGSSATYGKNQPVSGGYFAGYYNGKPNIVGRKLFVEV